MNQKLASAKAFVARHKSKIIGTTLVLTTAGTVLMFRNQREFNEFLRERNLLDEYYTPEAS